jgi:hypothetical protein
MCASSHLHAKLSKYQGLVLVSASSPPPRCGIGLLPSCTWFVVPCFTHRNASRNSWQLVRQLHVTVAARNVFRHGVCSVLRACKPCGGPAALHQPSLPTHSSQRALDTSQQWPCENFMSRQLDIQQLLKGWQLRLVRSTVSWGQLIDGACLPSPCFVTRTNAVQARLSG